MVIKENQKSYIFPRVPLNITLPEDYPDIGEISNVTVIPEINDYKFNRSELELWGSYQLIISYQKKQPGKEEEPEELNELECDEFFSHLKLEADGLFRDEEQLNAQTASELYTVRFTRPFHTYVSTDFITRPRLFKPLIIVERIDVKSKDNRLIKGELVLEMINKPRRTSW